MHRLGSVLLVGSIALSLCAGCGSGAGHGTAGSGETNSCPALPASNQPNGSLGAIVDGVVATQMPSLGTPGMTVAVAKNGLVLYAQGYGYADLSTCEPMAADAEMQIGSVTKQFTAAAVLQLQAAGLIDIDNTLVSYLSSYPFDRRITLRMLLNQTSGLQDYLNLPSLQQYALTESAVLNAIAQTSLLFAPGTAYAYSNSNYYILGAVIEAVTAQSYADYMAGNVFARAGLTGTFYLRPAASASPYAPGPSGPVAGTIPDPSVYFSAGQLWSNVQDLAKWDAALMAGKLIPQALVTLMLTPAPVPFFQQSTPSDYGMGWVIDSFSGHPFAWHNGETSSYTAFNGLFTDDGFAVTVLTNYRVEEATPLLTIEEALISAICAAPATSGSC